MIEGIFIQSQFNLNDLKLMLPRHMSDLKKPRILSRAKEANLAILIPASFCILIHPAPHLYTSGLIVCSDTQQPSSCGERKALLCSTCTARQLQLDEQPAITPNRKKVVAVTYRRR
ncbi:hypothetical protein Tco_0881706 [Tanacetum coccineum]